MIFFDREYSHQSSKLRDDTSHSVHHHLTVVDDRTTLWHFPILSPLQSMALRVLFRGPVAVITPAPLQRTTATSSCSFPILTGSERGELSGLNTGRSLLTHWLQLRTSTTRCLYILWLMFRRWATRLPRPRRFLMAFSPISKLLRGQTRSSSWAASPSTYEPYHGSSWDNIVHLSPRRTLWEHDMQPIRPPGLD
jgi:hypothetical protein